MKNYKLTEETQITHSGAVLFRIQALNSFNSVKLGDLGGWIEKENNLSGDAWVSGDAIVSGNAKVYGNAKVSGDARVSDDAEVSGDAFCLNFKHNLTLTDNHIRYGCEMKTVSEWESWLDSTEEFQTNRSDPGFKIIEMSLNLAIEQHKQINKKLLK